MKIAKITAAISTMFDLSGLGSFIVLHSSGKLNIRAKMKYSSSLYYYFKVLTGQTSSSPRSPTADLIPGCRALSLARLQIDHLAILVR
jgi:hypothetical protein